MRDAAIAPDEMQDPQGKNVGLSRDPERTPMQWSRAPGAGFTQGRPWLPLSVEYKRINVEAERDDRFSMLSLYRRLITLRRSSPALSLGSYTPLVTEGDLIAYLRESADERYLIVLNLGHRPHSFALDHVGDGEIVIATELERESESVSGRLRLTGDDGFLIRLEPAK